MSFVLPLKVQIISVVAAKPDDFSHDAFRAGVYHIEYCDCCREVGLLQTKALYATIVKAKFRPGVVLSITRIDESTRPHATLISFSILDEVMPLSPATHPMTPLFDNAALRRSQLPRPILSARSKWDEDPESSGCRAAQDPISLAASGLEERLTTPHTCVQSTPTVFRGCGSESGAPIGDLSRQHVTAVTRTPGFVATPILNSIRNSHINKSFTGTLVNMTTSLRDQYTVLLREASRKLGEASAMYFLHEHSRELNVIMNAYSSLDVQCTDSDFSKLVCDAQQVFNSFKLWRHGLASLRVAEEFQANSLYQENTDAFMEGYSAPVVSYAKMALVRDADNWFIETFMVQLNRSLLDADSVDLDNVAMASLEEIISKACPEKLNVDDRKRAHLCELSSGIMVKVGLK